MCSGCNVFNAHAGTHVRMRVCAVFLLYLLAFCGVRRLSVAHVQRHHARICAQNAPALS